MIKITLEKLLTDFQNFLMNDRYFLYDIINKKQILNDEFNKIHFLELNELIRSRTLSSFYDSKTFMIESEKEINLVRLFFICSLDDYLNEKNIDISNTELVQNNDVNINTRDLELKWLNIDKNQFRKDILEKHFNVR